MAVQKLALFSAGFAACLILVAFGAFTATPTYAAACPVDGSTLENLYRAVFHRGPDADASAYVGYDASFVLNEMMDSEEHAFYTEVFEAVKGIENARRQNAATDAHYDQLSNALGWLESWAAGVSQAQVQVTDGSRSASGETADRAQAQEKLNQLERAKRILTEIVSVIEEIDAELIPLSEELREKKENIDTLRDRLSNFNITESQMLRIEARDISEYTALLPGYNRLIERRERLIELWYVIRDYAEFGTMPRAKDRTDLLSEGISWD